MLKAKRIQKRTGDTFDKAVSGFSLSGVLSVFTMLATVSLCAFLSAQSNIAQAATSRTLNFQARLLSSTGSIVADGTYNIEFKLYKSLSSGASAQGVCAGGVTDDCLWLETRTGANKVTVKSGYVSVYLGDITALPSNIWNQQLWLTMNIGGTSTPSWDGEMTPRLRLTAVPAAYSLTNYNTTTGFSSSLTLAGATGGDQSFLIPDQGAAGTYSLLTTAAADATYLTTATADAAYLLQGGNNTASALSLGTNTAQDLTIETNNTTRLTVGATTGDLTATGNLELQGAGAIALTLSGAATTGISLTSASITTDISLQNGETIDNNTDGTINLNTTNLAIGGTNVCTSAGCNDLLTFTGNGLFTRVGNTISGITCSNGQTLTYTSGSWNCGTPSTMSVDGVIDPAAGNNVGTANVYGTNAVGSVGASYTSTTTGPDGFARIAYNNSGSLKFVQCTNLACNISNVATIASSAASYISVAMGTDGFARIAYMDGSNGLKYVQCTNAACTTFNTTTLDTAGSSVGLGASIAIGPDGYARISYYAYTTNTGNLRLIQCTNDSCSTNVKTTVFANPGPYSTGTVIYTSITMASDSFARIAYSEYNFTTTGGTSMYTYLGFVQCTNATCSTKSYDGDLGLGAQVGQTSLYPSVAMGADGFARVSFQKYGTNGDALDLGYVQCTNANCSTTNNQIVDTTGNVGMYTSIAIGTDGFARIAYWDNTNGRPKLARCTNAGCTSRDIFSLDAPVTGSYTSLTLSSDIPFLAYAGSTLRVALVLVSVNQLPSEDSSKSGVAVGSDSFARVAYVDNIDHTLKFIKCANTTCATRSVQTIDSSGDVGRFASTVLNAGGLANISYYDNTSGRLKFAQCTNVSCSTSSVTTVDSSAYVGFYTSTAMGSDNFARISYYDALNGHLKFAQCTNADCTTSNITTVDSASGVGTYASIAMGSDNFARISYYDALNGHLKFAQCTNADCTTSNITTVDSASGVGTYASIAMGSDNFARISYYDALNGHLKFAQCTNADCTTSNITTVDSASGVGTYASIAMGSDNFARISYFDSTNGDIKYAVCTSATCSTNNTNSVDWYGTVGYGSSIAISPATSLSSVSYYDTTYGYLKLWVEGVTQVAGSGGDGTALSALTTALADNSIDNSGFAQDWSWSTLTTQTALAMSADAMTSGGVLAISSSSTGLTGSLVSLSATGVGNTGNVLALSNSSSSGLALLISSGAVRIGDVTNNVSIDAANHRVTLNGTARQTRVMNLTAEYPGTVLDASGSNNTGSLTAPFDATQREGYYKWTTATATPAQTYDLVVTMKLPSDFSAWASSTPVTANVYSTDLTNSTILGTLTDTSGSTEAAWNTCSLAPSSTNTWETKVGCAVAGTYTAGGTVNLRIRMSAMNNSVSRIGTITLSYLSAF